MQRKAQEGVRGCTGFYLEVQQYLSEKGLDGIAHVGPYGRTTRERQYGCQALFNTLYQPMWEKVIKPYFEDEASKKGMIFEYHETKSTLRKNCVGIKVIVRSMDD